MMEKHDYAPLVQFFQVLSGCPEVGWWDLRLEAGTQVLDFTASDVFDPVFKMVDWLDQVVHGQPTSFSFDIEGQDVHLHTTPLSRETVFLDAWIDTYGPAEEWPRLAVRVDRLVLVAAFVGAINGLIANAAFFGNHWGSVIEEMPPDDYWAALQEKFRASAALQAVAARNN